MFFDAFLIFADAIEFDLIVLIEGKAFVLWFFIECGKEIFGVVYLFASDGRFDHCFWSLIILLERKREHPCVLYIISMINNELYIEVKNKWKSLYPIYFNSTKTLQEGNHLSRKAGDYPLSSAFKIRLLRNWFEQFVPAN